MNKHLKIYFSSPLFFGFFCPRAKRTRIRFTNVDSSPADFGSGLISCCLRFAWTWRSPRLVLVGRSSSRLAMVSCRHSTLRPRARPKQRLPMSKAQRWLASCRRHVLLSSENKLGWSSTDTVPMRLCPPQHQLRTTVSRTEGVEDVLFGVKTSWLHCCLFKKGLYLFKRVNSSCGCRFFNNTKRRKSFEVVWDLHSLLSWWVVNFILIVFFKMRFLF